MVIYSYPVEKKGKKKKKKVLLQFELSKWKNLQVPLEYISHALVPLGLGHDQGYDW